MQVTYCTKLCTSVLRSISISIMNTTQHVAYQSSDSNRNDDKDKPSVGDRLQAAFDVSKQHIKKAMSNVKTAASDMTTDKNDVRNDKQVDNMDIAKQHSSAAKEDIKQWGSELKQTATGDKVPNEAITRDLPHMNKPEDVRDRVTAEPVTATNTNISDKNDIKNINLKETSTFNANRQARVADSNKSPTLP